MLNRYFFWNIFLYARKFNLHSISNQLINENDIIVSINIMFEGLKIYMKKAKEL